MKAFVYMKSNSKSVEAIENVTSVKELQENGEKWIIIKTKDGFPHMYLTKYYKTTIYQE